VVICVAVTQTTERPTVKIATGSSATKTGKFCACQIMLTGSCPDFTSTT